MTRPYDTEKDTGMYELATFADAGTATALFL